MWMLQGRGNVYLKGSVERVAGSSQEFSAACYYFQWFDIKSHLITFILTSKAVSTHDSTRTPGSALVSFEFLLALSDDLKISTGLILLSFSTF